MIRLRWWKLLGMPAVIIVPAIAAWWFWFLPLDMLHDVGLRGPYLSSGRRCSTTSDARSIRCDWRLSSRVAIDEEVVIYSSRTRAVGFLEHMWSVQDSVTWQIEQDSIRDVMRRRGAKPLTCDAFESFKERLAEARAEPNAHFIGIRAQDAWTLPHREVRLTTYRWQPQGDSSGWWELQINAAADGRSVCGPPRATPRLLSVDEIRTEWRLWLADQFQF